MIELKVRVRDAAFNDIQAWIRKDAIEEGFAELAKRLQEKDPSVTVEEVKTLFAARPKRPNSFRSAATTRAVPHRTPDRCRAATRARRSSRRAATRARRRIPLPKPPTRDAWWAAASTADRVQFWWATFVESSGLYEVIRENFPCSACDGTGRQSRMLSGGWLQEWVCVRCGQRSAPVSIPVGGGTAGRPRIQRQGADTHRPGRMLPMIRPTTLLVLSPRRHPALAGPAVVRVERPRRRHRQGRRELDRLVVRAKTDPRLEKVRAYKEFGAEQLKLDAEARPLRVDDILAIVEDATCPKEIREEAASAIFSDLALVNDLDLRMDGKKLQRPRAIFSMKVLKLLTDNDDYTRALAKTIIEGLWPGTREPEILACQPRKRDTCRAARTAWENKVLK
jgi:hypothetical protein